MAEFSLGIELTAIHPNGARRRWQESEREELLDLSKTLYRNRGHEPLSIWVHWSRNPPLLKPNRRALAEQLCELIARHCSPQWSFAEVNEAVLNQYQQLPMAHLGFAAASSWESAAWREGSFHEVAPLGVAEVPAFLEREDEKTKRYAAAYSSPLACPLMRVGRSLHLGSYSEGSMGGCISFYLPQGVLGGTRSWEMRRASDGVAVTHRC